MLVAVGCSSPTVSTTSEQPASLDVLRKALDAKIDQFLTVTQRSAPTTPAGWKAQYDEQERLSGEAKSAFDDWSRRLDELQSTGKITFPAGTTFADADAYRTTLGVYVGDLVAQSSYSKACLVAVQYDAAAAQPCISRMMSTYGKQWVTNQAAMAEALKRAGL